MNKTKANIIANFAGRFVTAVLGIVFVPIYLRYLSVEMYGIIGFFTSIQAFLSLLDSGVSPTLNREVARLSAFPEKAQELKDLSRTLEIVCWSVGLLVSVIALLISPIAANYWLKSDNLSSEVVRESLEIMSVIFLFQWTIGFYMGGLYGLQEQKLLNVVNSILAVIRSFGAFVVLAFISPTIRAFLIWQLITTLLNCLLFFFYFWKRLPETSEKPRFKLNVLKQVWRYAAGMAGTGILVMILTQTDRIILSKMLPLESVGYYSIAITLAGTAIVMITSSIQSTYFPQFSQLVAQNRLVELQEVYHRSCQVMSFFLIPVMSVFVFFSYDILLVWLRNPEIARNVYVLLALVAISSGLNGLMHLPYNAQLAFGITKIGFWQNVIAVIFLVPFMIWATAHYGAVGGAASGVLLNVGYIVFTLPFMHSLILKGELKKWYLMDIGLPMAVCIIFDGIIYCLFKGFLHFEFTPIESFFFVGAVTLSTFICCAFVIPATREFKLKSLLRI